MTRKDFHHPFEPYHIQQQFMEAVYDCIEHEKVGIFESPTGTGKSLSLLCGSLTWLREHKRSTFDEAITRISTDDDEPEWIAQHARKVRAREILQMRAELDARLTAVRQREQKIRERKLAAEPASKKQKQSHEVKESLDDEAQFVLDEYESDSERSAPNKSEYSVETTKLMEKLGMLPKAGGDTGAEDKIDETKVFFCSRTHSQLSQFVGELKRVRLPPGLPLERNFGTGNAEERAEELKHLSLGSRKNLCINSKVTRLSNPTAINERCIELQHSSTPKDKKCAFLPTKENEDQVLDFRDHTLAKIRDIEDIASLGSKLQVCPYYASRPAIGPAEIVTLPYPLLLQKAAREALGISLKGNVVIIDEAHNLMNAIEGICSTRISDTQLKRARDGLITYLQKFRHRLKGSNRSYVTQVVRIIDSLQQFTNEVHAQKSAGSTTSPGALLSGKAVDQINLTKLVRYMNESKLARKVEGYITYLSQSEAVKTSGPLQNEKMVHADIPTLTHVQNFLLALMNPAREGRFLWSRNAGSVTIQYLLLDPSVHFREIVDDARAVILAGGTMSPIDDYRQQLFPYLDSLETFTCGHLIPDSSLLVRSVSTDDKGRLDFSFKARDDASAARLGKALGQIAAKVKGGMIVFFPSYGYLETVVQTWKMHSLLPGLEKAKAVFFDSRAISAEETFRAYSDAVRNNKRGALLLSVIGGKLSEGINFSDELGRCVVVVGLPYPNLNTPEWTAKMQYLEERAAARDEPKGNAGREHAENVCMRSVNQAIGRAIRHKNDWASIILLDARYGDKRIQDKLPGWIRSSFDAKAPSSLDAVVGSLESFFTQKNV